MTAKPISWPMNVDISYRPVPFRTSSVTSTPRMRLASVADRPSTDDCSSAAICRACWDSSSLGLLHGLGDLAAGLGPLLVDDLAALGAGLVADGGRLAARAGHRLVVVGLGGRDLLGRLAGCPQRSWPASLPARQAPC